MTRTTFHGLAIFAGALSLAVITAGSAAMAAPPKNPFPPSIIVIASDFVLAGTGPTVSADAICTAGETVTGCSGICSAGNDTLTVVSFFPLGASGDPTDRCQGVCTRATQGSTLTVTTVALCAP